MQVTADTGACMRLRFNRDCNACASSTRHRPCTFTGSSILNLTACFQLLFSHVKGGKVLQFHVRPAGTKEWNKSLCWEKALTQALPKASQYELSLSPLVSAPHCVFCLMSGVLLQEHLNYNAFPSETSATCVQLSMTISFICLNSGLWICFP